MSYSHNSYFVYENLQSAVQRFEFMWTAERESFSILQMQRFGKIKWRKYGNKICNFNKSLFCFIIIGIFVQ